MCWNLERDDHATNTMEETDHVSLGIHVFHTSFVNSYQAEFAMTGLSMRGEYMLSHAGHNH